MALVATSLISLLFVLPQQVRGHVDNPYMGIVVFLVLPAIFFTGLALIPIGVYLGKRKIREGLAEKTFDRKTALRRIAWFFGITTLLNILIGTQVTYRAVEHMETPQFCGATCHTMSPEFAAYQNSPHSKVECVECHVAPGVGGWIHSKASGVRQLVETVTNSYPRPIPSALETNRLVPARETCENCHWPQKFGGVSLRVINKYSEDEANSRTQTVLMMMIGGNKIRRHSRSAFGSGDSYPLCGNRRKKTGNPVGRISQCNQLGEVKIFASAEMPANSADTLPKYDMQCVDCHNRPTHTFELPEQAMDKALARGDIAVTLPYIKKRGTEALKADYRTSKEAADKLPSAIVSFYQTSYPDLYAARSQDISQASQAILAIYNRNVFPDLEVTWGTYPNNLGHMDSPGCFRCHDGSHTTTDGKTIAQDCNGCHEPLAMDEASPEILKTLGIAERISKFEKP